jgi:hypothetical protein
MSLDGASFFARPKIPRLASSSQSSFRTSSPIARGLRDLAERRDPEWGRSVGYPGQTIFLPPGRLSLQLPLS